MSPEFADAIRPAVVGIGIAVGVWIVLSWTAKKGKNAESDKL